MAMKRLGRMPFLRAEIVPLQRGLQGVHRRLTELLTEEPRGLSVPTLESLRVVVELQEETAYRSLLGATDQPEQEVQLRVPLIRLPTLDLPLRRHRQTPTHLLQPG